MTAASSRIAAIALLVLSASVASAQTPNPADAAFKRGRELLKAGKYADACIEFEHSNKLDPALGTEFNIAQCSEKIGKLARALELYRDMAARDTNADRKKVVVDAIPKLEARVPHLVVKVAAPPAGFALTIQEITTGLPPRPLEPNKTIEIDFGEYTITAKAPGASDWTLNIRIDTEAKTTSLDATATTKPIDTTKTTPKTTPEVKQPTGTASLTKEPPDEEEDRPEEPPKSKRKLYGIVGIGVGGAALITGVVFGTMAKSKWSDAKDVCGGTTCTTQADVMKANKLADSARGKAKLSTVFVIGGVAAAATGVVLFVTAPKSESATRVTAHPTGDGAGITLSGTF